MKRCLKGDTMCYLVTCQDSVRAGVDHYATYTEGVRHRMDLPSYFNDMLSEIRPSQELLEECAGAHTELREFLLGAPELKGIIVTTFLQGSYRRSTLVRPAKDSKPDVDVVVVTNLDPNSRTPAEVQNIFCSVLDKHPDYRGHYQRQGRSIGLSHGSVNLDLVITAAPSEVLTNIFKSASFDSEFTVEANPSLGAPQEPAVERAGLEERTAAHSLTAMPIGGKGRTPYPKSSGHTARTSGPTGISSMSLRSSSGGGRKRALVEKGFLRVT